MKTVMLTMKLSKSLFEEFNALTKDLDMNRSAVMRRLIENWIATNKPEVKSND